MIAAINRLRAEQRGAIALMTLVFMLLVGVVSILFLWSLSTLTGAYNTLYAANQNAAIAAATTAGAGESQASGQLNYPCRVLVNKTVCFLATSNVNPKAAAPALFAAKLVMTRSLATEPFGMKFEGPERNVALVYDRLSDCDQISPGSDCLEVFNVELPRGQIEQRLEDFSCRIPESRSWGSLEDANPQDSPVHCWEVKEAGLTFPPLYTSGVISRARAEITLLPGCPPGLDLCQQEIEVTAAATQEQLVAPSSYP